MITLNFQNEEQTGIARCAYDEAEIAVPCRFC